MGFDGELPHITTSDVLDHRSPDRQSPPDNTVSDTA
jgi:hypothetical protein